MVLKRDRNNEYNISSQRWSDVSDQPLGFPLHIQGGAVYDQEGVCVTSAYFDTKFSSTPTRFGFSDVAKDGQIILVEAPYKMGKFVLIDAKTGDLTLALFGMVYPENIMYFYNTYGIFFYSPFQVNISGAAGGQYKIVGNDGEMVISGQYNPEKAIMHHINGFLTLECEQRGSYNWLSQDLHMRNNYPMYLRDKGNKFSIYSTYDNVRGVDMIIKGGEAYDVSGHSYDFIDDNIKHISHTLMNVLKKDSRYALYEVDNFTCVQDDIDRVKRAVTNIGTTYIVCTIGDKQKFVCMASVYGYGNPKVFDAVSAGLHDRCFLLDGGTSGENLVTQDDSKFTVYDLTVGTIEEYDDIQVSSYHDNGIVYRTSAAVGINKDGAFLIGSSIDGEPSHKIEAVINLNKYYSVIIVNKQMFLYNKMDSILTDAPINYSEYSDLGTLRIATEDNVLHFVTDDDVKRFDKIIDSQKLSFSLWNF